MSDLRDRLTTALGDRYAIEREVGSGGMAIVYLAQDLKHGRPVALKVLRPELAAVLGADRFLREIDIAAKIEHPHVLTLIDSGEADGLLYYVMPFVRGESLRDRLVREGRLPVHDAVRMLRDVADGLAEAHRQGLVHRDIKPDNVMMSGKHAVVTDFGVAKALTSATGVVKLTTAGMALGTPAYMSPEQAGGQPDIDHRTDIYALGVLGYELLAGRPPFEGTTTQGILAAHLTEEPEPVSKYRPEIPSALADLIMRCLAKDPTQRWQSTDELLQVLESIATPSGGVPSMRIPVAANSPRRSHTLKRALFVAPLLIAALALVVLQQRRAARMRELVSVIRPAADSGQLDLVHDALLDASVPLDARGLHAIATRVGGTLDLTTDPRGANVTLWRITAEGDSTPAQSVGTTPLRDHLLVAGPYIASLQRTGYLPLTISVQVPQGDTLRLHRTMVDTSWDAAGMVLVDSGPVTGPLAAQFAGVDVPAFLIDRTEVTNEAFMRFVADGGYRDRTLWPDSLRVDGRSAPWDVAIETFVDRSGIAGPRNWTGGTFPEGSQRLPVTGISWYEAQAYARWAGKTLPSLAQWWRAALGDVDHPFPWGNDVETIDVRANFSMAAATPVGSHTMGVSPFGAYDLAGNVREWLRGTAGDERFPAVGGSWQDPTYMFYTPNVERFAPDFSNEAVGFRLVRPVPNR